MAYYWQAVKQQLTLSKAGEQCTAIKKKERAHLAEGSAVVAELAGHAEEESLHLEPRAGLVQDAGPGAAAVDRRCISKALAFERSAWVLKASSNGIQYFRGWQPTFKQILIATAHRPVISYAEIACVALYLLMGDRGWKHQAAPADPGDPGQVWCEAVRMSETGSRRCDGGG